VVNPTYPGISEDFAETFQRQKTWDFDIWVAAHGSQYRLHDKYDSGEQYSPNTFVDPEGLLAEVKRLEKLYLDQIKAERR
jgi:metallo-beta-lactamase class B